jgi:CRP/FNR family transcriptional regulator, cyclic AMP receptor protein
MTPYEPDSLKNFLLATPAFAGLEEPAISRVVRMVREQAFPAGATVYNDGDPGNDIYVIRNGDAEAFKRTPAGAHVTLARLGVGDVFGEMSFIDMQPRSASVTISKNAGAVLCVLTNKDLYSLYREDMRSYLILGQNIARELCRRIRKADNRVCELTDELGYPGQRSGSNPRERINTKG